MEFAMTVGITGCVGRRLAPRSARRMFCARLAALVAVAVCLMPTAWAQRTKERPPWNMYSPETDIKVGHENAQMVEHQMPLCNDPKVDAYLTTLGMRLVAKLPTFGATYPWEFHCVNDKSINAFALPGGFVFINRGAIESADNEAQLAGVMAHELSHVALRHGTAQASKSGLAQGAAGILGAIFGGSAGGSLAAAGASAGAMFTLLHYSRAAESQADILGTQVLYDAGYDPRALAQFFEKLEAESKGKQPPQFFSDHPNPENRLARVQEEVDKLGGVPPNARRDSPEFQAIKREVHALPEPKKPAAFPAAAKAAPPPTPSSSMAAYQAPAFALKYPSNWKQYGEGNEPHFAPEGGIVSAANGQPALAYGVTAGVAQVSSGDSLEAATQKLIANLKQTNPNMKVYRQAESVSLNGQPALSTYLSNDSPVGGEERDWVLTVLRPQGLVYYVATAPTTHYSAYDSTFTAILDSVRFTQ
jgi:hypothetical protein